MERIPRAIYTRELREEAVKLVSEGGSASRKWGVGYLLALRRSGTGSKRARKASCRRLAAAETFDRVGNGTGSGQEELAQVKIERDILKKATAYFAKESLPGTR